MKSLDKYVTFSIAVLLIYAVAEFLSQIIYGVSHDTLTTCVFAAFSVENFSCALIKVKKISNSKIVSFNDAFDGLNVNTSEGEG